MSEPTTGLSRRTFVKSTTETALGLTLAFYLPEFLSGPMARFGGIARADAPLVTQPNAFLRIDSDGIVTVLVKHLEMGQGVYTGLPMLVAEELEVDWANVRVESAPADAKLYNNLFWGPAQGTGGSSSVANSWDQLRMAGATAREMLVDAAADQFKVERGKLKAEKGFVVNTVTGEKAGYGELADLAAKKTPQKDLKLKEPKDFKVIGQSPERLDGKSKTNGTAQFALDVRLPGQLTALVARPPAFGAKLKSFDAAKAKAVPGVKAVVEIPQGIAVVAEGYWAAKTGREALTVVWDESASARLSTPELSKEFKALLGKKGSTAATKGKVAEAAKKAVKKIEATYEFPYLAHAPMEVLNCVVQLTPDGGCEIWSGDQMQTGDQYVASMILGAKLEQIKINTLLAGGSFGRRANATSDYIGEGVAIAKATKDLNAPIHLMWSREDDVTGGYYRPMVVHKVKAGIDKAGKPLVWDSRIVGQSIMAGGPMAAMIKDGVDPTSVEGVSNLAYDVPNLNVELHSPKNPISVLWWRSVGHTHTAFVAETMIDELAHLAGKDPVEYRLAHLTGKPRHVGVLKLAAAKAGWGKPLPKGHFHGVAVHESFNTFVAQVAEVSVTGKTFKVERIVCAVDCGIAVYPDNVVAQMEGGIGFSLGAALHGEITLDKGRVVQSNFHDYQVLRMNEMPVIEVHIVPSADRPSGVGEPGVPPVAPAVANALAAATGKRLRRLPLKLG